MTIWAGIFLHCLVMIKMALCSWNEVTVLTRRPCTDLAESVSTWPKRVNFLRIFHEKSSKYSKKKESAWRVELVTDRETEISQTRIKNYRKNSCSNTTDISSSQRKSPKVKIDLFLDRDIISDVVLRCTGCHYATVALLYKGYNVGQIAQILPTKGRKSKIFRLNFAFTFFIQNRRKTAEISMKIGWKLTCAAPTVERYKKLFEEGKEMSEDKFVDVKMSDQEICSAYGSLHKILTW